MKVARPTWPHAAGYDSGRICRALAAAGVLLMCAGVECGQGPGKQPLVWPSIQQAAEHGDVADMKRHQARGIAVNSKDAVGYTSLSCAAGKGKLDAVKYLIEQGADVNSQDGPVSFTPLHEIAMTEEGEWTGVIDALLARGADLNARSKVFGVTPLLMAARQGRVQAVDYLIARGAEVNTKDTFGISAIAWARRQGHADVVTLLRRHGARE